ncbi:hypothetical protein PTKIN_Ptkin04bG0011900 [Pterospermum kingtungense]
MGKYCAEVRKLALELMGTITESLGIGPNYLGRKMDDGMQVMAVNCYPPCPEPDMALGLQPHSDYTCITIVLQSSEGLEILDAKDGNWKVVPELRGALQVHVEELVDEQHPKRYEESSFRDFLDFLATNDIADGKSFIDTLKA